jgi:hypothetical protein
MSSKKAFMTGLGNRQMGKSLAMAAMVEEARKAGATVYETKRPLDVVIIDEASNVSPSVAEKLELRDIKADPVPPRKLSIDPNDKHFHPCYQRVGVRIDGKERNDIHFYNLDDKSYMTVDKTSHLATTIEPYWRFIETRQQRRARLRWEEKHG